jgi:glutamate carboxypeptidase
MMEGIRMSTQDFSTYFQERQTQHLELLRRMVELESPSNDKALVDRCGDFLAERLALAGAQVTRIGLTEHGDIIRGEWGEGQRQILLLCHFDTVWEKGALPWRVEANRAYGPGVFDMKAGVMFAITALEALRDLGKKPGKRVVCLFTTDEELGSPSCRPYIEEEAKRSNVVLCLEPGVAPDGALKTLRKGPGIFKLKIHGRAAHAGGAPEQGRSAILELSHQIQALWALNNTETGTTVNVGTVRGGTRYNVVADYAEADIDLRVWTREEGERISNTILALKPITDGVRLEVTGGLNRPPFERTEAVVKLFEKARACAAEIGVDLEETGAGGFSDGNLTAALGIPTLDGLGAVGEGAHAVHEHILIDRNPQRQAVLTRLIETV